MTGAMYAAIAGLRTHMQNLNVIGNNVANVNTYGYKSARSVFATSLYTSLNGGSDGTNVLGGVNPSQIGYGAEMGSVGIDMSTGNLAITGKASDHMLDGDGFFIVGSKTVAQQFRGDGNDQSVLDGMNLTRVGDIDFGADGYLANNDGQCVYGFLCIGYNAQTGDPIYSDQLVPIRLPGVTTLEDGTIELVYPIPGTDNGNPSGPVTFQEHGVLMDQREEITTTAADGSTSTVYKPYTRASVEAITFDKNTGIITAKCRDTSQLITIGVVAVGNVKNPNGVTNMGGNYYQAGEGSGGLSVSLLGGASTSIQWGTITGVGGNAGGGGGAGTGNDTAVTVATGTGATMQGFMNQSRLANAPQNASEIADVCRLRDGGETRLLSNGLEMSKTDLAQEISQMILTQRGYQANTRIVTVTDSMLEELVNMKR